MALSQDILAELAEIVPGSPLAEARATRDAATRHAQGSYEILFSQQDAAFALDERFAVAAKVAKWHHAEALAAHYAGFGLADPTSGRLTAALNFARLLTFSPVDATPGALQALVKAGWSKDGIVTLAQLIAFVSFQSRLIAGLRLLNENPLRPAIRPSLRGHGTPAQPLPRVKRPPSRSPSKSWAGSHGLPLNLWQNLTMMK